MAGKDYGRFDIHICGEYSSPNPAERVEDIVRKARKQAEKLHEIVEKEQTDWLKEAEEFAGAIPAWVCGFFRFLYYWTDTSKSKEVSRDLSRFLN